MRRGKINKILYDKYVSSSLFSSFSSLLFTYNTQVGLRVKWERDLERGEVWELEEDGGGDSGRAMVTGGVTGDANGDRWLGW